MSDFLIRKEALTGFDDIVKELGGEPDFFYKALEVEKSTLAKSAEDNYMPYEKFIGLLNKAAEELDCPSFGMLMADKKGTSQLGLISLIIETSSSVYDALLAFSYFLKYQTKSGTLFLKEEGDKIFAIHSIHYQGKEPLIQAQLHAMGVGLNLVSLLGGSKIKPVATYTTFDKVFKANYLQQRFSWPLYYNSEFNGVVFNKSDLMKELPKSDPVLNELLKSQLSKLISDTNHDFELQLRTIIKNALAIGDPSIERVAAYFSKNKRTLQRELSQRNLSFKQLLDDVRISTAKHHLQYSALSLTDIANLLGYSDPSAFSRFFSKEEGISPLKWRKEYRK